MKKFLQGALLPFSIFATGLALLGCDQAAPPHADSASEGTNKSNVEISQPAAVQAQSELKSGNMFYVIRDVADLQLKAGDYVEQLQQTQENLRSAVDSKDIEQLQRNAAQLKTQLKDFDQALSSIQLKTREISDIRQNVLDANHQVLASPLLNGATSISQADMKKIEQQMVSIQSEMFKLAGMLIQNSSSNDHG